MRVIAGSARGMRLATPEGQDTRPTPEKVKEAVFSSINFELADKRVLDLFAGSGQLGIEALSRGAGSAVFADSSAAAVDIIKENLKKTHFEDFAEVYRGGFEECIKRSSKPYDIVFLDPPYALKLWQPAIELLNSRGLCGETSLIIAECPYEDQPPMEIADFECVRQKKYGTVAILYYRHKNTAAKG